MATKIPTIAELKQHMAPIIDVNKEHKKGLSPINRLALAITQKVGSMGFFFVILSWIALWLVWNIFVPKEARFDPFPGFVLLLFLTNILELLLMPLIMVGQNIQGKHADLRSEHDFQTDTKAEKEIETILLHLEHQEKMLEEMSEKIKRLETKLSKKS